GRTKWSGATSPRAGNRLSLLTPATAKTRRTACSADHRNGLARTPAGRGRPRQRLEVSAATRREGFRAVAGSEQGLIPAAPAPGRTTGEADRKSTRLNS